jgi:hypothetical protein
LVDQREENPEESEGEQSQAIRPHLVGSAQFDAVPFGLLKGGERHNPAAAPMLKFVLP